MSQHPNAALPAQPLSPAGRDAATGLAEADGLAALGYRQELRRGVGSFSSFAAGFSFVSILTTVFQLFGLGFGFGGAAFFWTWPLVFAGQMLVALNFAELAARWPVSGAIYQWSTRLAGKVFGWFTGWTMIVGQILTVAVAAVALQAVLPSIWDGFQIVGGSHANPTPTSSTGAENAVLLGCVLLVVTTVVTIVSVRVMALVTSAGVVVELIGVSALIALLFFLPKRSATVVLHTTGAASGGSYLFAWLASALMAAYVLVGFDAAGELSEETRAPRRTTPKTIVRAVAVSGLGGGLLILAGLIAAPSLTDGNLASGGLAWVVSQRFGSVLGRLLLCTVAVAVFACTLACQTAGSRMVFSMARENALPFSRTLAKVSPRTGTPITASLVVGVGAVAALVVNIGQTALFTALSSLCIAMLYLAYLGVTGPLLWRRLTGWTARLDGERDEDGHAVFSLGRFGIAVGAIAVLYQAAMVVNLLWPRTAVYDTTGDTWWLRWSGVLFIAGATAVGGLYYAATHRRHRAPSGITAGAAGAVAEAAS
ncbi:urea carboxylase system permease [Catenulispora sp. GAS73]|uniref:amino acid permease n=1 Tax=Catenulispora sp. GAS73 TaxID=3156269 RepID=UPI0035188F9E